MTVHSTVARLGAALLLASAACGPAAIGGPAPDAAIGPLALRAADGVKLRVDEPIVRIGLSGDGRSVELQSGGGLHIVDGATGRDVWKHLHQGPVRVVLDRKGSEAPVVYRVQVASFTDRDRAELLAQHLREQTGELVDIEHNPDRNAWRVRAGQRGSREEIREVEDRLRDLGFAELWVVEEIAEAGPGPTLRLVDQDWNDMPVAAPLVALPARRGQHVQVGGTAYRGAIEIVLTRSRRLQVVNVVNREDYLRGVVPKELGPLVYPEIEALKAQAVAARTYVEANRGQFSGDGYDICDTARCQVYGGVPAEHELSDAAVDQTRGIVAIWEGAPINALYTSTCGGHTEDLKNVFREMKGPYLRGVRCYPEQETQRGMRRILRGAWTGPPVVLANGERIDDAVALLEALGILSRAETDPVHLAAAPTGADTAQWVRRTLDVIGKKAPDGFDATRAIPDLASLADHLVDAVAWGGRVRELLHPDDIPALLGDALLEATPEALRPSLAWMVKEGIVPRVRGAGAASGETTVTRALLVRALHRLILRYDAAGTKRGRYRGVQGDALVIQPTQKINAQPSLHPIAPRLHLVVEDGGGFIPVAEHPIQEGDVVTYHVGRDHAIDYLTIDANRRGASDDRYSGVYAWEVRVPREDLEERIRRRASIGRLVDLDPGPRGISGRLKRLTVVGSRGRFDFHGFAIERLLGLRESLFLVDRQFDAQGRVETFIFAGKGWGHGVGMCQVGAYGMALRGRTWEEILSHYYTGITLERR